MGTGDLTAAFDRLGRARTVSLEASGPSRLGGLGPGQGFVLSWKEYSPRPV